MSFRTIDVTGRADVVPADQPMPMLDWVPISRLLIDDAYQRPLARSNWQAIEAIAAKFNWAFFAPVLVSPVENGLFALIDGQHRTHAAAMCGYKSVPAMISLMSQSLQAASFAAVNGVRVNVTVPQMFRAALAGGEAWAVRCDAVVSSAGCRLMPYNCSSANRKPREIYAIGMVRKLLADGHAEAVRAVLTGIATCAARDKVALYHDFVLGPLFAAVAMDPAFLRVDMAAFLNAHDPYKMIGAADRIRGNDPMGTAKTIRRDVIALLLKDFSRAVAA
jgi:hypothetical protein